MSEAWMDAWSIHKHAAAEAAHVRWMETKRSHGFADHPFSYEGCWNMPTGPSSCSLPIDKHHDDMVPFADLSPEIQAYDYASSVEGFRLGFQAGFQAGLEARDDATSCLQ